MQTLALTTENQVEIISAYAATNQQIDAVEATPGWHVIGAFHLPVSTPARVELVGSVSEDGLTLRVRLFDVTAAAPVSGTTAETTSTVDARATSGSVDLIGGHIYQFQAEVIGDAGTGTVQSAALFL